MTIMTWQEAKELQIHETAKAFPKLLPEEFDELKHDITQHGVREPVLINRRKDTLLDGVHRRKACVELTIDMPIEVYQGEDERGQIISRNLYRRHLTDDQRVAMVTKLRLPELRAKAQSASHKRAIGKWLCQIQENQFTRTCWSRKKHVCRNTRHGLQLPWASTNQRCSNKWKRAWNV